MPRPIRVRAALRRKLDQKGIKALDHADRIGVRMVGLQHGQAATLRASRLRNEYVGALAA
jgi:hypothetical protein